MASLRSSFDFFHFLRLFHFPTNFFRFLKFPNLSHPHETPTLGAERGRKQPTLEQNRRKNLPCTYPAPTYPRAAGHIRGSLAVRTTFRSPPGGETREGAYPGATLELPWSGRAPEKRPHRRGSRVGAPLWTWPDIPLRPSSPSVPSTLPPFHPPPPGAPQGPRVSQKPPAHAYPGAPLGPSPGPLGGAATGRATWAARLGLVVQFPFSAKTFPMGNPPNRLTAARGETREEGGGDHLP